MISICHNLQSHVTVKRDQSLDAVISVSLIDQTKKNHQLSSLLVIILTKNITEVTKHALLLLVIQKDSLEPNNGKFSK